MYNDDEIVVLETANGEEIEFILLGEVTIDKYDYVILKPVILLDGMADDEAIAFKVSTNADGSESFNVVEDEKLMLNNLLDVKIITVVILCLLIKFALTIQVNIIGIRIVRL